jgi:hypothetical protein
MSAAMALGGGGGGGAGRDVMARAGDNSAGALVGTTSPERMRASRSAASSVADLISGRRASGGGVSRWARWQAHGPQTLTTISTPDMQSNVRMEPNIADGSRARNPRTAKPALVSGGPAREQTAIPLDAGGPAS